MALSSCFANLIKLSLTEADGFASAMVQQVFESCPNLTVFKGNPIHVNDNDQGEQWICLGLKEWILCFSITTGRNAEYVRAYSIIFGQLGRLTELRILNTSRNTSAVRILLSSTLLPSPEHHRAAIEDTGDRPCFPTSHLPVASRKWSRSALRAEVANSHTVFRISVRGRASSRS